MTSSNGFVTSVIIYIIIIFSLLILLASFRVLSVDDFPDSSERLDLSTIKTGDILGASYQNGLGYFIGLFLDTMWSHVGVAWRDPKTNGLFVLEAANYHDPYKGVFKIPIENWVRFNKKNIIGLTRLTTPAGFEVNPNEVEDNFDKIRNVKLDTFNFTWWRLLFKKDYDENYHQSHYTCYELAVKTLQNSGVFKKRYMWSSYTPGDIMKGLVDMEDGFKYSKPTILHVGDYYNVIKSQTHDSNKGE